MKMELRALLFPFFTHYNVSVSKFLMNKFFQCTGCLTPIISIIQNCYNQPSFPKIVQGIRNRCYGLAFNLGYHKAVESGIMA